MGWILGGFAGFAGAMTLWLAYNISDSFHVFARSLLGVQAIHIKGVTSAIAGSRWKATIETDPFGEVFAYRYPATKIGHVTLREDGSGEYCGQIIWKPA